jgi:5S rRNA maturation endonuclease (ribonuclease M5)
MGTTPAPSSSVDDNARLVALNDMLADGAERMFHALDLPYREAGPVVVGCCPVHGGDNPTSFNLFTDGHSTRGNWVCYSRSCQTHFRKTPLGFIRGVQSHRKFGWAGPGDKTTTFVSAVQWACGHLGVTLADLRPDSPLTEKRAFARRIESFARREGYARSWPLDAPQRWLKIPSSYFLGRGFREETLRRYMVGEGAGRAWGRAVAPILDKGGQSVVGLTGRSVFPQCDPDKGGCGLYHPPGPCPSEERRGLWVKWKHSPGFDPGRSPYNAWWALPHIRRTGVAVLVEGVTDVWRLEEAGIPYSMALYGVSLQDAQQVVLEQSGGMTVVLVLDPDPAGRKAQEEMARSLSRLFRVKTVTTRQDVGDMPVEDVVAEIVPQIRKWEVRQ